MCECLLGSALAAAQLATRQELKRGQTASRPSSVCVATNLGVKGMLAATIGCAAVLRCKLPSSPRQQHDMEG